VEISELSVDNWDERAWFPRIGAHRLSSPPTMTCWGSCSLTCLESTLGAMLTAFCHCSGQSCRGTGPPSFLTGSICEFARLSWRPRRSYDRWYGAHGQRLQALPGPREVAWSVKSLASRAPLKREHEANLNHTTFELDPTLPHLTTLGQFPHHTRQDIPKRLNEGANAKCWT
jgi:hypothetical protein